MPCWRRPCSCRYVTCRCRLAALPVVGDEVKIVGDQEKRWPFGLSCTEFMEIFVWFGLVWFGSYVVGTD